MVSGWFILQHSGAVKPVTRNGMEDVIFNGTSNVKPLGFCEVYLTVENDKGLLPLEYNQVEVGRKLYRSGESEYFINKNEKKLSIVSLISEKNKLKDLVVFSDFKNEIKKTKEMNILLNKFASTNALIIVDKLSKGKIYRSTKRLDERTVC